MLNSNSFTITILEKLVLPDGRLYSRTLEHCRHLCIFNDFAIFQYYSERYDQWKDEKIPLDKICCIQCDV